MAFPLDLKDARTRFGYGLALLAFVLLTDQISKWWILNVVRLNEMGSIKITSFFALSYLQNHGVSFGLLRASSFIQVWGLTLMQGGIAAVFLWWMRTAERGLTTTALALVVGGALGNLIDRVRFGGVVDFLDFQPIFPWVFNVADAAITVGAALLVLDYFGNQDDKGKKEVRPAE